MILRGIALLARGKTEGMKEFGNSFDAFAASLAPLIAFPLVGAGVTAANGQPRLAALAFLTRLCAVLIVPVITYEFARFMKREAIWLRTVTALDWSFWLVLPLLLVAAFCGAGLVVAGVARSHAELFAVAMIVAYMLWFQWFTIRAGLNLTRLAALALVGINSVAVTLLTAVPMVLMGGVFGPI